MNSVVVSYDQMSAVLNGTIHMKALPLSLNAAGGTDWSAEPVAPSSPCLGCPLSHDNRYGCQEYNSYGSANTLCGATRRKDGRAIVWRKV